MKSERSNDTYIEADGLKVAYRISGTDAPDAPWAVILQGWGTHYALYDPIAALIGDRFRVLQFDLPGFGSSEEPAESWDVERYAEFVTRLLDRFGIGRAMLIGHSYGGRIIIRLASEEDLPFEISCIVLIDSAGVLPVRTARQRFRQKTYRILKRLFDNKIIYFLFDEIIDDWKSRQGSEDYRRATPVMRGTLVKAVNEDLTDRLNRIAADTLLIWGELDTATPIRDAHIMEERIPRSGLAVIPGVGHFSYAEDPARFAQILNAYLESAADDTEGEA